MKEVTPDPLPICLLPVSRQALSLPFSAVARVAIRSPPPPGSDEMVPNQCPAFAEVSTRSRCSRQAFGSTGGSTGSSSHSASTVGCMLFAAVTTAYILVGIWLEERDLVALFGEEYRRYREKVAMLLPGLF